MRTFRLYFGRKSQRRTSISNEEMDQFQRNTIDPAFDSYTVFDGTGKWRGESERVTIVEIVTDPTLRPSIDYIAAEYARRFHQDAVLVTSSDTTFDLVESPAIAA